MRQHRKLTSWILSLSLMIGMVSFVMPSATATTDSAIEPEGESNTISTSVMRTYNYSEGLALAQQDGLWGYVSESGAVAIPLQYTSARAFSLGMAQVTTSTGTGLIRTDGQYLLEPIYSSLQHINAGLYLASQDGMWGVVSILPFSDGQGGSTNVVYSFIYDSAQVIEQGGTEVLVLYQGTSKTSVPVFTLSALLTTLDIPSAQFPLVAGRLPSFTDVSNDAWYAPWVNVAYNVGLVNGVGGNLFAPEKTLTVAEALQLAADMESQYIGDDFHTQSTSTAEVWYQSAVDYCITSGIITRWQFTDYTREVTRSEMAQIFGATSLASDLPVINSVTMGKTVPDVSSSTPGATEIYHLYATGILAGVDDNLTFNPDVTITRAEVATIVSRMARTEHRITF